MRGNECTGPEGLAAANCKDRGSIRNVVTELGGASASEKAISEPETLVAK